MLLKEDLNLYLNVDI